jgi:hypothetical protein
MDVSEREVQQTPEDWEEMGKESPQQELLREK